MSKKIEIELFRYGNLLFGKVSHIDDSLREIGILYEGDKINISSTYYPTLNDKELFVRGSVTSFDNNVFQHLFKNEETAIEVAKNIKNGINFINEGEYDKNLSSVCRVI